MSTRDTVQFWKSLLVVVLLGLPSLAQSGSGCSSWVATPDLKQSMQDDLGPRLRETAVDPSRIQAYSESAVEPLGAQRALAKNLSPRYTIDCAASCPLPGAGGRRSGSQLIAGYICDQYGIVDVDNDVRGDSKSSSVAVVRPQNQPDLDGVYYRNRLEFTFDGGWLPINIPFVFDVFLGDAYNRATLDYTLVPLVASLRWHINDVGGPWILRGNWDMTVSGSITLIPRGPETRYFSYDMGIRRNFVPRRGKIAPYFDGRLGLGQIDAKGPLGVSFAQGQNFTFTVNLGSGVRYNFNPRYSVSAGLNWMHISNLYLSEPAFSNYGINVYGPMFGIDVRLGKARHASK
jgi:hypothetical protein